MPKKKTITKFRATPQSDAWRWSSLSSFNSLCFPNLAKAHLQQSRWQHVRLLKKDYVHVFMSVAMCMWAWVPEEAEPWKLELRAAVSCLLCMLGAELGSSEEQYVLLTAETSFQPQQDQSPYSTLSRTNIQCHSLSRTNIQCFTQNGYCYGLPHSFSGHPASSFLPGSPTTSSKELLLSKLIPLFLISSAAGWTQGHIKIK